MTTPTTRTLTIALSLILAGAGLARADGLTLHYVDDQLDLVDSELEAQSEDAGDLEALPVGLEPVVIEPRLARPDDLGGLDDAVGKGFAKGVTGPLVGDNYIRMYISDDHVNAGSTTDYIYARFGQRSGDGEGSEAYQLRLWAPRSGSEYTFERGDTVTWDLESVRDFLEAMPQDNWDQISFLTPSGDGILVRRVVIVHSGMEILDWTVNRWLDSPNDTSLGFAAKIVERKLQHVGSSDNSAIHSGALEIGKTNGFKYGTGNEWCSEFASWALHREGFMTPYGSIGTDHMKDWFSARGRLYTRSQVVNKTYVPRQGDYLSVNSGNHSCLFLEWVDPTDTITGDTRFRTLDGNWGDRVTIVTRTVSQIDRVGKAQ